MWVSIYMGFNQYSITTIFPEYFLTAIVTIFVIFVEKISNPYLIAQKSYIEEFQTSGEYCIVNC